VPQHTLKLSIDYTLLDELSLGLDANLHSGQFLRGDEANLLGPTDAYAVLQARARYRLSDHLSLFGMAENVLNTDYETFGLLGEADEVFPDFEDNRFVSPNAPIGAWIGARIEL
jgi:outer membrane cobalamin receptor